MAFFTRGSVSIQRDLAIGRNLTIVNPGYVQFNDAASNFIRLLGPSTVVSSYTITLPATAPGTNQTLQFDGTNYIWSSAGSGTVTSVALTAPVEFSVSGSPITGAGTLAITKTTQPANFVWAGPATGGPAVSAFRALVSGDIPVLSYVSSITAGTGLSGGVITSSGTINIATTGVAAAAYGSASSVATFTVNTQGQLTTAATTAIQIGQSQVTSLVSDLTAKAATTLLLNTGTGLTGGGDLSANRTFSIANTSVIAGSYGSATQSPTFTVNAQGQLTIAGNTTIAPAFSSLTSTPTTLAGYGVTDAIQNVLGTPSISSNAIASRPVFGTAGRLFVSTDTKLLFRDTGSAWEAIAGSVTSIATGTGLTGGTITGTGTIALADTAVVAAAYGSASAVGTFTVDAQGRLTTAATTAIQIGQSQVTSLVSDLAAKAATATTITAGTGLTGGGDLSANRTFSITNTAVTLGAYGSATQTPTFTVNAQGQLTAAANVLIAPLFSSVASKPTTLAGYGITDGIQNVLGTPSISSDLIANRPTFGTAGRLFVGTDTALIYRDTGAAWTVLSPSSGGTVTSVALSLPAIFTVSGSPVTTTGTLTGTLATQTANIIFAGPSTGGAAVPTFRSLVSADIPTLDFAKITSGTVPVGQGGTGITTTPSNGQIPIGDGTTYSAAALTAGIGVAVTNGAGSITLAATGAIPATVSTSTSLTLTAANCVVILTATTARSVTLPTAPVNGSQIMLKDGAGTAATANISVVAGGADTLEALGTPIDADGAAVCYVYLTSTTRWYVI